MPLNNGQMGDKLIFRLFKYLGTRPDTKWVNTYEFVAGGSYGIPDLQAAVLDFVNFEKAFHADAVVFDRWTWSTWEEDSVPYNPASFLAGVVTGPTTGMIPMSTYADLEPLDVVFWVTRVVDFGRQGKLFYRGALGEPSVTAPAGVPTLQSAGMVTTFNNAKVNVADYVIDPLNPGNLPALGLSLITKTGAVRQVTNLEPRGVAINKRDRGYFDKI